ncbi:IS91 family transposase [Candidatus Pacearchaeota archaeon]|nr:IS91 family transposase [Candidatus Pacearchaeota archaeon]
MSKSTKITVNDIFRDYAHLYAKTNRVTDYEQSVIRAIISCRTEAQGGRVEQCDHCGHTVTLYNSCRNRHCPLCQFLKKEKWVIDKKNDVLPFQYFHAVFTIPDELNPLVYRNRRRLYKFLFDIVKQTLQLVSEDTKYFGARTGFFSILHTWGQKLNLHPHIHCVIPGGGYAPEKKKWITAKKNYLLPIAVLKRRFRSLFLTGLKKLYHNDHLFLNGTRYTDPAQFQNLIDRLFKKEWVVYIKESFNNSDSVIEYLSRYTHRIAISNYRIIKVENGMVFFSYRDYKDKKKKIYPMTIFSFIRHFLLHIVPYRFVRIRYYGLLSHRNKKHSIEECREYYAVKEPKHIPVKSWQDVYRIITGIDVTKCGCCGVGRMVVTRTIVRSNIYLVPP